MSAYEYTVPVSDGEAWTTRWPQQLQPGDIVRTERNGVWAGRPAEAYAYWRFVRCAEVSPRRSRLGPGERAHVEITVIPLSRQSLLENGGQQIRVIDARSHLEVRPRPGDVAFRGGPVVRVEAVPS